jgi:hypothetical protein
MLPLLTYPVPLKSSQHTYRFYANLLASILKFKTHPTPFKKEEQYFSASLRNKKKGLQKELNASNTDFNPW